MDTCSLDYVDDLYYQFNKDPNSVPVEWRQYFEQFLLPAQNKIDQTQKASSLVSNTSEMFGDSSNQVNQESMWLAKIQDSINRLVREYRVRGHLIAQLDPLGIERRRPPELDPEQHGISPEDLNRKLTCQALDYQNDTTLSEIVEKLRNTYCRSIGAQFTHIDDRSIRDWLQQKMERTENRIELSQQVQRRIFARLADAEIFESFMRKKFVGAKTFSLEGSESLIPLLDRALEKAGNDGVKNVVMGMAHRGRLNVLANIMKKRAKSIFWSFDDPNPEAFRGGGDVRYHLGYSNDWVTSTGKKVHISLCFNPSHLEFVNPVALGRCRAKQDRESDFNRHEHMTILIHGDAAFAGEGIVQETLNLSELKGYSTGGTLHVVLNNQIGFTTEAEEGRSSIYATDVAKMLQIPIFHVNGEDPEAVTQVVMLAMEFRKKYQRDVVIDMYAYRKLGHNEGDEPRYTQPLMYRAVDARKGVKDSYRERLFEMGGMTEEQANELEQKRFTKLTEEFNAAKTEQYQSDSSSLTGIWEGYHGGLEPEDFGIETAVNEIVLKDALSSMVDLPSNLKIHKKLSRFIAARREMSTGNRPLDWANAESLAFATILLEGRPVRLSGQDCQRGTFSQRHAVLHDVEDNQTFTPLEHLSPTQGRIEIINSPLSESGVLGFEYGYSLDCPEGLVAWEAQFGDFWNVAQPIVDQFITSAEDKWNRLTKLTMLLPHGFEGAGPEHCSARLERFLLLAAEHNVQVTQPTTPSQYFHLLRRQTHAHWSKPLIVLTPKSLLRHPSVVSDLNEFSSGTFQKLLPDNDVDPSQTKRILLCSGKSYYELAEERKNLDRDDVAIVRIEQFYPLSTAELKSVLDPYPQGCELVWYQEEPENMGAWQHLRVYHTDALAERFNVSYICRAESASPSTGSQVTHKIEQRELLDAAFSPLPENCNIPTPSKVISA